MRLLFIFAIAAKSTIAWADCTVPLAPAGAIQFFTPDLKYCDGISWLTLATTASSSGFANGGNSFGGNATIGLNDNYRLDVETNGLARMTITSGGSVGIGTTAPAVALDVNGGAAVQASYEGISTYTSTGASYAVPDTSVNIRRLTLNNDTTITLPAFSTVSGKIYNLTLFLKQDATGSRTVTWAAGGGDTIKWDAGVAPIISSSANSITVIQLMKPSDESVWYGSMTWREN